MGKKSSGSVDISRVGRNRREAFKYLVWELIAGKGLNIECGKELPEGV